MFYSYYVKALLCVKVSTRARDGLNLIKLFFACFFLSQEKHCFC